MACDGRTLTKVFVQFVLCLGFLSVNARVVSNTINRVEKWAIPLNQSRVVGGESLILQIQVPDDHVDENILYALTSEQKIEGSKCDILGNPPVHLKYDTHKGYITLYLNHTETQILQSVPIFICTSKDGLTWRHNGTKNYSSAIPKL